MFSSLIYKERFKTVKNLWVGKGAAEKSFFILFSKSQPNQYVISFREAWVLLPFKTDPNPSLS